MYPRIALSGWMRSGKDSVADHLSTQYGYLRGAFADILKAEVAVAVPCSIEDMNVEPLRTQIRPVLQAWGTEFRRSQDPDYWVKKAEESITRTEVGIPIVFTDARFPNELDMLRSNGFLCVKLDMPEDHVRRYLREAGRSEVEIDKMLNHPSETAWQGYDFDVTVRSEMGQLPVVLSQIDNIVEAHSQ